MIMKWKHVIDLCLNFETSNSQMVPYVGSFVSLNFSIDYRFLSYGPWNYGYDVK